MAAGGKGANQAVAAARLGAEVTLVAKVGRDVFGDQAIENFRREGIRTDCILRDPDNATGVALILVDDSGENLISVASGANHALTPQEIDQAADRIRAADVLMLQLEIPMDTVCRAAQIAAEAGVPVILDPAPAAPLPDGLLRHVTYLTPNESEAERLTGIAVTDEASARRAAERLLAAGARHVIVTLGAKGALWPARAHGADSQRAGRSRRHDRGRRRLQRRTGLGAGQRMAVEQAVRQACLVGALSATRLGAAIAADQRGIARFAESLPQYVTIIR